MPLAGQDGYRHPITLQMSGKLLSDLLTATQNSSRAAQFHFAHSETLLPLVARLGVARDLPSLSEYNLPPDRKVICSV